MDMRLEFFRTSESAESMESRFPDCFVETVGTPTETHAIVFKFYPRCDLSREDKKKVVREIFRRAKAGAPEVTGDTFIPSQDLCDAMAAQEGMWAEFKRGKPITPSQLARLLSGFEISPVQAKLMTGEVVRGYWRSQFKDAWERYLPALQP